MINDIVLRLIDRLRYIKNKYNLTQQELSKELGISQVYVSYILSGKRFVSIKTINKIEDFLKKFEENYDKCSKNI